MTIKDGGKFTRALAIAILCFCPPDNWAPLSPTKKGENTKVNCFLSQKIHVFVKIAFTTNQRVETFWQFHDEVKGICLFGCLYCFILSHLDTTKMKQETK